MYPKSGLFHKEIRYLCDYFVRSYKEFNQMLRIVLTLSEYRLKITVFKQRAINKPRYISTYSVSIVRSSWN